MANIPRLYIDFPLSTGQGGKLTRDQSHYLTRVMRREIFLGFHNGAEFECRLLDANTFMVGANTGRADPSENFTFYFAPIKKIEELIGNIVQMGAAVLQPVITERTQAGRIKWDRMRKIIIEAAEQSGRNSVPELCEPVKFADVNWNGVVFGDERKAMLNAECLMLNENNSALSIENLALLIGPEGGFSVAEFAALDRAGAVGVGLGPRILRAETAAVALSATIAATLAATLAADRPTKLTKS